MMNCHMVFDRVWYRSELVLALYIKPFFLIGRNAQITRPQFPCYLLNLELDCKITSQCIQV